MRASTDVKDVQGTAASVTATLKNVVGSFTNVVVNVTCDSSNTVNVYPPCDFQNAPCLFNVTADPCEYNNVAGTYPDIAADLARDVSAFRNVSAANRFRPAVTYRHASPPIWIPWVKDAQETTANDVKCSSATSSVTSILMNTILTIGFGLALSMV